MLFLAQALAAAPRPATDKDIANVKKRVEQLFDQGRRVIVEMRDGHKVQGSISEVAGSEFVIVEGAYKASLAYADVKKLKAVGPSVNGPRAVAIAVAGGLLALAIFAAHNAR